MKISIQHHGPSATHNLDCWFCQKRPAVYAMHPHWCFRPCWTCQRLMKLDAPSERFKQFLRRVFLGVSLRRIAQKKEKAT